jgi:hypothetical protein
MMIAAGRTVVGHFYRLSKPVCPGTYYMRVSEVRVREIAARLQRRTWLTTEDARVLHDARLALKKEPERILMSHRTRFRMSNGTPRESIGYIGVKPDYKFREVKNPPGYGGRGNGD